MIVADANLISYFWIQCDKTTLARKVRRKDAVWIAPYLWRSEFRSILRDYLLHGELSLAEAIWIMEKAERSMHGFEHEVSSETVLKLVNTSTHSSYDCEYVALAEALRISLVTDDRKLIQQFPDIAIGTEDFLVG